MISAPTPARKVDVTVREIALLTALRQVWWFDVKID